MDQDEKERIIQEARWEWEREKWQEEAEQRSREEWQKKNREFGMKGFWAITFFFFLIIIFD